MQVKKQQLELDMEQQTGSKSGKEYVKAVYCHPAYLTYRRTFVGKEMSLLLNMLPRLVITFPPRSKHLLISWLQSLSRVILGPKKIKSFTISIFSLFAMK